LEKPDQAKMQTDAGNVSVWSNIGIVKSQAGWQADLDGTGIFSSQATQLAARKKTLPELMTTPAPGPAPAAGPVLAACLLPQTSAAAASPPPRLRASCLHQCV